MLRDHSDEILYVAHAGLKTVSNDEDVYPLWRREGFSAHADM